MDILNLVKHDFNLLVLFSSHCFKFIRESNLILKVITNSYTYTYSNRLILMEILILIVIVILIVILILTKSND